jgi:hypothetical protein
MKKVLCFLLFFAAMLAATGFGRLRWGFFAHKRINYMAVFTLPPGMIGFYKKHIEYISAHAVDPDKRRYADPSEGARHFIDSEWYGKGLYDSLPEKWKDALSHYGADSLQAHGIVPWHIQRMLFRLQKAFEEHDAAAILKNSADIGHYIGDAHVPLHTTSNYDGQFSNQRGIHAFWESRIPELQADQYNYFAGRAEYLEHPAERIWKALAASYAAKDSVLGMEADLSRSFPSDLKYAPQSKGTGVSVVYSEAYSAAYEQKLGHMIERRMRESIHLVGSFWYTAWVMAGQPDLDHLTQNIKEDTLNAEIIEDGQHKLK